MDGNLGFTGGVGFADEWRGHSRDTQVRVQGPRPSAASSERSRRTGRSPSHEHNDVPATKAAGRAALGTLLADGVKVHEYEPSMLHLETMIVVRPFRSEL